MAQVVVSIKQREWQKPLVKAFRDGIRHAMVVAHRRAGKDRVALFIELEQALRQRCEVWHALPEQEHARKVVWNAITGDGQRLLDAAFPAGIVKTRNESEMKIELKNGSIWRLVGADRFNALVGANPKHVTFSEFAITDPRAREFIRPILAENNGSELEITTPRGYNHAFDLFQQAMKSPRWYAAIHPVSETKLIPEDVLAEERASMPDELYRQEYECDWSAANIGAIVGRYMEDAEKQGRVDTELALYDPDGLGVEVSTDIGFRDAAAFWFWQPRADGYALVDYMTDSGMDAEEWIEQRLATCGYDLDTIWLPHDARAKTFQSRHTVVEQFLSARIAKHVRLVPQAKIADRVNAARMVIPRCRFAPQAMEGVKALRAWQYKYDTERKVFSKEPEHDWASHGGDAFSYGAQVILARGKQKPAPEKREFGTPAHHAFTLDDLANDARTNPALANDRF